MFDYEQYLRLDKLPHIWCAGCGDGTVLKAILRAIDDLKLQKDDVAFVSGIGCSSRTTGYIDFNTLHTTHGRPIAFATGLKLARPDLTVIVVTGDGDAVAIGGNHFIHAARRNIDITVLLYNNYTYGMTGGQYSPSTPEGSFATTAPYGNIEPCFDICKLAEAAGATFVARGTTYHAVPLTKMIEKAIMHKGFSLVEIITQCPTNFRYSSKRELGVEMLEIQKRTTVTLQRASTMTEEQLEGKITTGILVDRDDKPEYTALYDKIIEKAQERLKGGA